MGKANLGQNKFKRYIRLDQLFRDPEGHTLEEILTDINMDCISKRTLQENLKEFEEEYGAKFDVSPNAYRGRERLWRYKDSNFSIFNQINKDVEIIRKAIENLKGFAGNPHYDYIRFFLLELEAGIQNNKTIMSFDNNQKYQGLNKMEILAQAIIHQYPIKLTYKTYKGYEQEINVHPYHLRQYNQRWFLFGFNEEKQEIHNYPLDRIERVEHLSKIYRPTDIDFDKYFDDIIGVSNYKNREVCDVVLKVDKKSIDYIRTKPFHSSQTELKEYETEQSVFIRLRVKINTELEMKLFSYNNAIEVISPIYLRDKFAKKVRLMSEAYKV